MTKTETLPVDSDFRFPISDYSNRFPQTNCTMMLLLMYAILAVIPATEDLSYAVMII